MPKQWPDFCKDIKASPCPFCGVVPVVFGNPSIAVWIEHRPDKTCPLSRANMLLSKWERRVK